MIDCQQYVCKGYLDRCWLLLQVEGQVKHGEYNREYLATACNMADKKGEKCLLINALIAYLDSLPLGLSVENELVSTE